jgi:hypothetical protein
MHRSIPTDIPAVIHSFFLTFPFVASYFSLALGRPEHSKVCRAGHSLILAHMPVSLVADDPFFL